jgi:hypothetical protein
MKKWLTLAHDESGMAGVICAIILVALCGFVALAIDVGHLVTAKTQLQRTADAAALAGAMGLVPYNNPVGATGTPTPNWVQGQTQAHTIINNAANQADNYQFSLTDGTVLYGYWFFQPPTGYVQPPLSAVPTPSAYLPEPAVTVTLSRPMTLYFAPIIGVSSPITVSVTATAVLPTAYQDCNIPPIAVAYDTVYEKSKQGTMVIDIATQDFKIQSNGGIAGWFNLNGGNSVPSVRIDTPMIASTTMGTQVYLVPGTKATLTDYMTDGECIVVPIVQDVSQKVWAPVIGFAAFQIDPNGLGANSITGHFVDTYFDPNVPISSITPTDGTIGAVAGTPKLVSP